MKFTGERFIPESFGAQIALEHWHRYFFAANFCKDKIVLDIACGEGYGSFYLSRVAKKVYGIDISEEAIRHAKNKYSEENINFIVGDVSKIPLEDQSIEVVVSFETIEHVPEDIQHKFLKEVKRILKKEGVFICSTPDKYFYSDLNNYKNEFHIKEFYKKDYLNFLRNYFRYNELGKQHFYPSSVIVFENDGFKLYGIENRNNEYKPLKKNINKFNYLISISSDNKIDSSFFSSVNIDFNNKWAEELLDENKKFHMIQLFYDYGEGFNERDSEKRFLILDEKTQNFSFSLNKERKIKAIRFDPLSAPVVMELKSIFLIKGKNKLSVLDKVTTNAIMNYDNFFLFETADPQIYFKNLGEELLNKADSVEFEIYYQHVGNVALQSIFRQIKQVNDKLMSSLQNKEVELENRQGIIEELRGIIENLNLTIKNNEKKISQLENEIIGYVTSNSWKITRPLRMLKRFLVRFLRRS